MDLSERISPLTYDEALHLLRRTTFSPTHAEATRLTGMTPRAAVADLRAKGQEPTPPAWANEAPDPGMAFADAAKRWPEMQRWWAAHVLEVGSFRDKMTLFWHNVFTSDYITAYYAQYNIKQHYLLRSGAFGPFGNLAYNIVGDPAMLRYLNGEQSIKGNPNENFAREFFELFTLGVGNYTEADIVDAARAFTGWRVSGLNGVFNEGLHDTSEKTILGQTGRWNAQDVVRITLEQPACARWVARLLYRQFIDAYPSEESVQQIADVVLAKNYSISDVLDVMLASKAFYDPTIRGALIKSPADMIMSFMRVYGLSSIAPDYVIAQMTRLTQEPFYPPTVQGWTGHHAWITSTSFPLRQRVIENAVVGRSTDGTALKDRSGATLVADPVAFAKQLPDPSNARAVVADTLKLLIAVPTTTEQQEFLLDVLLSGLDESYWNIDDPSAVTRLRGFLQTVVRMPEFQLI